MDALSWELSPAQEREMSDARRQFPGELPPEQQQSQEPRREQPDEESVQWASQPEQQT